MGQVPQENADLSQQRRVEFDENAQDDPRNVSPPDGGVMAYAVMMASFLINGLIFGIINSYSVIYTVLEKQLQKDGESPGSAASRAALVGSLSLGSMFLLSPVSGVLAGFLGLQVTAILGGLIGTTGLIISSFIPYNVDALKFTYGVMYGLGASFSYTPSLAILSHYFKKYLGVVNGFVTIGSSAFTVLMPPLMDHVILHYGLAWMFRVLATFTFGIAICGLFFKPLVYRKKTPDGHICRAIIDRILTKEIWKIRRYRFWAMAMPVALFGYFVPYVHIKKFMLDLFVDVNFNLPLQCMAIASAFGRLLFGFLADRPGVDTVLLQQMSFYVFGILTITLAFMRVFWLVIIVSLIMGLFDGACVVMIGPIASELCGSAIAAPAIGWMLGLVAIPLSLGPAFSGYLYTLNNSYTLPFVFAGMFPIFGATLLFVERYFRKNSNALIPTTNSHSSPPLNEGN